MRKRALSVLLCAALALSLAACGGGQTGSSTTEPPAESTSSGQQTTEPESTQPEETEPAETKPEETKPAETEPEETKPTETAPEASAFLALLQNEYKNDKTVGTTQEHMYIDQFITVKRRTYFGADDTVYFFDQHQYPYTWFSYNTATKTQTQLSSPEDGNFLFFLDGALYYQQIADPSRFNELIRDDLHGNSVSSNSQPDKILYYGGGILACPYKNTDDCSIYSANLEKVADVSVPQLAAAHGLTEPVTLDYSHAYAADGKVYVKGYDSSDDHLYCLDPSATAPEWTDMGTVSTLSEGLQDYLSLSDDFSKFCGKYYCRTTEGIVYDITTGDQVFEFGELYAPAIGYGKIYFGGDSYIGYNGKEYRMVNLANGTMSDPLTLPENYSSLVFINDTCCVYTDEYGCFLWDYNTGEETTIIMFE